MAKQIIRVEVESGLLKAIEKEAAKQGKTSEEVVRNCARIFLSEVSYTSERANLNSKRKGVKKRKQ